MAEPKYHSAEHVLTAVLGDLANGKILDVRLKGTKVRCDYEISNDIPLEILMPQAEKNTNDILLENREITYEEMPYKKAREICSLHRLPEEVETVRIVKIGKNVVTPCRGEHVKNTKEIGALKIRTFAFIAPNIVRLTFGLE